MRGADRVLAYAWSGRFTLRILTARWHRAHIPRMEDSTFCAMESKEESADEQAVEDARISIHFANQTRMVD